MMIWKMPNLMKGTLTWVPYFNKKRQLRASTGGSVSARYCYSVLLRHLMLLNQHGFSIKDAIVGELGPGDTIGVGIAALLGGAKYYVGLDVIPFSEQSDLLLILDELVELYESRCPIPDDHEFPRLLPVVRSFEFPHNLVHLSQFDQHRTRLRVALTKGVDASTVIRYYAPWTAPNVIAPNSLDLVFSQAVLEHVDDLQRTYQAMFQWLRPGGYASHLIDFSAHYLSPYWNGHWAYNDWQWHLVRGQREFLLNRWPLSTHLKWAESSGFRVLAVLKTPGEDGLPPCRLAKRFQQLETIDYQTRCAMVVLQKV